MGFCEDLKTVRVIGAGAAGVVRLVMNKKTGRICWMILTYFDTNSENSGWKQWFYSGKITKMTWQFMFISFIIFTLRKTNMSPENQWLEVGRCIIYSLLK